MLADGKCEVTGEDGIIDLEAGGKCACKSSMMAINCDGRHKITGETLAEYMSKLKDE